MILGLGIDIVEVSRIEKWLNDEKLLQRFFNKEEIEYVLSKENGAARSLAVRFAAKEAFGKALGTGLSGIELKDIVVVNDKTGRPFLKLSGTALQALNKKGGKAVHISLSHEKATAAAVVVIEGLF
ncbi:holo-ACP synthase [Treponema putidum]|uniref:Holo-[acyl-carrier-protein] synthase n=1 Tax=Treponema putidum TaxID=221027 RepID=A0AAE9SGS5_9SPIR|nr:holo-ACP synthase [Treponema putidum]AIN94187.1 4'-phosphopantetheinyl transferase [Treponema putidum]TWI79654.1 holo-[acyl-carrier protein] synthase [Treponema putidum]UTY28139.1 holo-ACP synthase [Treponema putidum]UTY30636.1 holo-ACP synthase [Treponema putidum]UTY33048.1 holo-ACP synthase [Treponema putidum]